MSPAQTNQTIQELSIQMNDQTKSNLRTILNTTFVLMIILTLSALLLIYKVENFAVDIVSDVKNDLIQEMEVDAKDIAQTLEKTDNDINNLSHQLQLLIENPQIQVSKEVLSELKNIKSLIGLLQQSADQLTSASQAISDKTIHKIADTIAETYIKLRRCQVQQNT